MMVFKIVCIDIFLILILYFLILVLFYKFKNQKFYSCLKPHDLLQRPWAERHLQSLFGLLLHYKCNNKIVLQTHTCSLLFLCKHNNNVINFAYWRIIVYQREVRSPEYSKTFLTHSIYMSTLKYTWKQVQKRKQIASLGIPGYCSFSL